jgi:hypothetical protein
VPQIDFPESVDDPIDQLPQSSGLPGFAPFTECFVDDNLPGGIFEKTPFLGFSIEMAGTCVFPLCCKADTPADNTTESEMDAAIRALGRAYDGQDCTWMIWESLSKHRSRLPKKMLRQE